MRLGSALVPQTAFWMRIWACTEWLQNLCQAAFTRTETTLCRGLGGHAAMCHQGFWVSEDCGHGETNVQSSQWKHQSSQRAKKKHDRFRARWRRCWLLFFDYQGVVHHEYAPEGQSINNEYYQEVLCHVCDAIRHKSPKLWATGNWQSWQCSSPFSTPDPDFPN